MSISATGYAYSRFADNIWLQVIANYVLGTRQILTSQQFYKHNFQMEFLPVKFFDMGDTAALSFLCFYLSLKLKFGIS